MIVREKVVIQGQISEKQEEVTVYNIIIIGAEESKKAKKKIKGRVSCDRSNSESSNGKSRESKQQLQKDILKNLESKLLDNLKTLNNEIDQILVDIYNNHHTDNHTDLSKYERHINSLITRTENNSYTHYLLEVLIEKIHERIKVIYKL